jgi:hypothetical protein
MLVVFGRYVRDDVTTVHAPAYGPVHGLMSPAWAGAWAWAQARILPLKCLTSRVSVQGM